MARGKQQQEKKDGQHRKETKEERRARLQAEREAKEQCLKILPIAAAIVVGFLLLFSLYVRSVPAKVKEPKVQNVGLNSENFVTVGENDGGMPITLDANMEKEDILEL